VLVLTCFGICLIWKYKGCQKPHGTGHASNSSITRKTGKFCSSYCLICSTIQYANLTLGPDYKFLSCYSLRLEI
jgi:hypothetical protein